MSFIKRFFYSLFYTSLCLTTACQKDTKVEPQVQIISPVSTPLLEHGDTLEIEVEVKNGDGSLTIDVLDGSRPLEFGGKFTDKYQGSYIYELYYTNRYISSGTYTLRVSARNGDQTGYGFHEIKLQELAKERTGLIAATKNDVLVQDTAGNTRLAGVPNTDFLTANSFQQRFIAGDKMGLAKGFSFPAINEVFTVQSEANSGLPQFAAAFSQDKQTYLLEWPGSISVFDESDQRTANFSLPAGIDPVTGTASAEGILVVGRLSGKSNNRLLFYPGATCLLGQQIDFEGQVKEVAAVDENIFVILSENSGHSEIHLYRTEGSTVTKIGEIDNEAPGSMVVSDNNTLIFSTERNIYQLGLFNYSQPVQLYTFAATDMEYDQEARQLYFSAGTTVFRATPGYPPELFWMLPSAVTQIELIFNK